MKTFKKLAQSKLFVFTLCALMINLPIMGQIKMNKKNALNKRIENISKEKSGEQMFREILFLEGDIEINIPSFQKEIYLLKNLNEKQQKERTQATNNIISVINDKDKDFFNYFKKSILSDNPFEIQKAVSLGANLTLSSMGLVKENQKINDFLNDEGFKYDFSKQSEVENFKKDIQKFMKINNISQSTNDTMGVRVCVAGPVVLVYAIAAAAVVVAFQVWFFAHGPNNPNTLESDMYIKQIIKNY